MKRTLIAIGLVTALAVPAGVVAKPSKDARNAKKECTALKRAAGAKNFASLMRTSKRKAFGKCVARKTREEKAERRASHNAAVNECRTETFTPGTQHGKPQAGEERNAFGQCVARKQHQNKAELDRQDKQRVNAARQCRAEQGDADFASQHGGKSFADFYGTNANKRNAFGKCVSKKAREKNDT